MSSCKGESIKRGEKMEKIKDTTLIRSYYNRFEMHKLFESSILDQLELIRFNKMEYLCYEQEKMTHLMFFVEGRAKVFRTLANGKRMLICFYEPFEVMGEVELLQQRKASSNAQALSTCYVLALKMEIAREKLGADITFLKFACSILSEKLHNLGSSSAVNLFYPLENRLAYYILIVTECDKKKAEDKRVFNENLTYLSELLGVSYRHLLRTLNELCQKSIIVKEKGKYIVISEDKLQQLAGDLL